MVHRREAERTAGASGAASSRRIVLFGNSGSGKTTMARALARRHGLTHLDLDGLAWDASRNRRPLADSAAEIDRFVGEHANWVIEGCYGDLLEQVLPHATEVRFLNPGVEVCVANCLARPWEPEKYPSKEAQDEMLDFLIGWVREYESRADEYSLARHRALFDGFGGTKFMYGGERPPRSGEPRSPPG
ncbi:MAG: shikimate kinase [Gemmatimonadales bacterium]|nr:MAG: shikimate kinase [Gemmatimonadales bacterium]